MTYDALIPMLTTPDLKKTRAFWEGVLGFECDGVWPPEGEAVWCSLRAGGATIMFSYDEPHDHGDGVVHGHDPALSGALYVNVDDVDSLHERIKDRVNVTFDLQTMDYGMREFHIVDPNGYLVIFGQGMER